jgi:iron complex transport system substrate-binding protein
MRIVSLLPAATEICFALGLGDQVVGVSPECDYPAKARELPVASKTLLELDGRTSREVSQTVGEKLRSGEALYAVDERALADMHPDLILTQGVCDVCAPSLGDVREVAERLPDRPEVLSLDPHGLHDVFDDIARVGEACGLSDTADDVIATLGARVVAVRSTVDSATDRPNVLCLEWLDPLFLGGHWIPEMIEIAGGTDVLARAGEKSRRVEAKDVVMADPEVVVLMPCGFDLNRTAKEAGTVTRATWWNDLRAARSGRVWMTDGSAYFNRPGPRLVRGLEILAAILHPDLFPAPGQNEAVRPWKA